MSYYGNNILMWLAAPVGCSIIEAGSKMEQGHQRRSYISIWDRSIDGQGYRTLGSALCLSKTRGGWRRRDPNRTRKRPNKATVVDLDVFLWRTEMPTWTVCDLWEWTVSWKAARLTPVMFSVCTFLKNAAENSTCGAVRTKFLIIAHLIKGIISIRVEMF